MWIPTERRPDRTPPGAESPENAERSRPTIPREEAPSRARSTVRDASKAWAPPRSFPLRRAKPVVALGRVLPRHVAGGDAEPVEAIVSVVPHVRPPIVVIAGPVDRMETAIHVVFEVAGSKVRLIDAARVAAPAARGRAPLTARLGDCEALLAVPCDFVERRLAAGCCRHGQVSVGRVARAGRRAIVGNARFVKGRQRPRPREP